MQPKGWTIRYNWGSDRPDYEADTVICRHHGKTIFLCDSITKKPLPASALCERCPVCNEYICSRCAIKMRSGGVCEFFRDRVDREEYNWAQRQKVGLW